MGRKKSRKVGLIGVRKTDAPRVTSDSKKPKKHKGNKAGTRQGLQSDNKLSSNKQRIDPKIGSKTPIDLTRHLNNKTTTKAPIKFKTPKHELDHIEQDQKLQSLLDLAETKPLSKMQQDYVDKQLARHKVLCDMLGIAVDEEEFEESTDPLSALDAISIDDFKN